MLTEEQVSQIKQQLIQQIESTFPDDKKNSAIQQIEAMNNEQLEEFLKQNNLIRDGEENQQSQCIFCSIASGQVPSTKIKETENAVVVLEINPVSYGHTIIIPKQHLSSKEQIPKEIFELAKEISEIINTKLNPKNILIETSNAFGHEIINIIPVYENETLTSPRKKASPEDLELLQTKLISQEKEEIPEENSVEEINEKNTWLPRRIP